MLVNLGALFHLILFKTSGFEVDIAGNGLEALELMKKKMYTLVLMDLMMVRHS